MDEKIIDFVGIPYETLNCWELCIEFYEKILGIKLQHYIDHTPESKKEINNLIYTNIGDFRPVSTPSYGDIILIKIEGVESHIGIYLGNDKFLHSRKSVGSVIDRVSTWKYKISGYYTVGSAA